MESRLSSSRFPTYRVIRLLDLRDNNPETSWGRRDRWPSGCCRNPSSPSDDLVSSASRRSPRHTSFASGRLKRDLVYKSKQYRKSGITCNAWCFLSLTVFIITLEIRTFQSEHNIRNSMFSKQLVRVVIFIIKKLL